MTLVGQVLLDRYRVDAFLGSGGMSVVYRVWDKDMHAHLAMKILHADLVEDPKALTMFEREARALKKLAHPQIVPFYGLFHTGENNFLLERFIDGVSLKELLKQRQGKSLSIEEALIFLKALCAALGYAHINSVVHCDVKPGNVMIDRGGDIYLTDFGIARHAESTTTTLGFSGTVAYMSPEQINSDPVTAETDIYALAILFYELITGRRPFLGTEDESPNLGNTAAERVRIAHLSVNPPDPRQFNPDIPESLVAVVLKALSKQPEDRFPSTAIFLDAVCRAVGTIPEQIPNLISTVELKVPTIAREKSKPRLYLWVIAGFSILTLIVGCGIIIGAYLPSLIPGLASSTSTPIDRVIQSNSPGLEISPINTASYTPTETSTFTNTPTASETPRPTTPSPPTNTPRPTNTPLPSSTPTTGWISFYVKNGSSHYLDLWIDGDYFGNLSPGQTVTPPAKGWGSHSLKWCITEISVRNPCSRGTTFIDNFTDLYTLYARN